MTTIAQRIADDTAHAERMRLADAAPELLAALREAQEALDVLAGDAADAGFPARAEAAAEMAMRFRAAIAKATGEATS